MKNANEILNKMNPNQKINYDRVLNQLFKSWERQGQRPKILLHSCCAPCSTYTLEYLTQYADVDIYFSNSNIHPRVEYERRAKVQQDFIEAFNKDYDKEVKFIEAPYVPQEFIERTKDLTDEPEGGTRCTVCFDMRLGAVAQKAKELGYDYFGSALTISPHKNSQVVNEVGLSIQEEYDINYLPSDFKKNNGYRRSVEMCEIYDIYRQCYCGCVYAAKQQGINLKEVSQEAKAFLDENRQRIDWKL